MTITEKLEVVKSRYKDDEEMKRAMKELSEMRFSDDPVPAGSAISSGRGGVAGDAAADMHAFKVFVATAFWGLLFLAFYVGGADVFKPFVNPVNFRGNELFYGAAAFVAMVVCGANALACLVIGRRKNANLFMLFVAVSFTSIFIVLSLFGVVFSFFAGQAATPGRRDYR